jgi:hypothetical protein
MAWSPHGDREKLGHELVKQYGIREGQLTNCFVCHR